MYNQGKPRTMLGRPSPQSKGVNNPPGHTGVLPAQARGNAMGLVDRMRSAVPAARSEMDAARMAAAQMPSGAPMNRQMGQPVRPMGFMGALRQRKAI